MTQPDTERWDDDAVETYCEWCGATTCHGDCLEHDDAIREDARDNASEQEEAQ